MRIVVVEDNEDLREEVLFQLRHAGHLAEGVGDAVALDALLQRQSFDIAVIDIGLPGEDGLSVAERLRRGTPMGIVMMTARGSLEDRVAGVESGADVYLVKPVDMRELLAVLGSVHRRVAAKTAAPGASWEIDTVRRDLVAPDGVRVALTDTEFRITECLARLSPAVASRRAIAEALDEDFLNFDERRLEAAISRLRRKIQEAAGESPLRTARARGYVFAAPVRVAAQA